MKKSGVFDSLKNAGAKAGNFFLDVILSMYKESERERRERERLERERRKRNRMICVGAIIAVVLTVVLLVWYFYDPNTDSMGAPNRVNSNVENCTSVITSSISQEKSLLEKYVEYISGALLQSEKGQGEEYEIIQISFDKEKLELTNLDSINIKNLADAFTKVNNEKFLVLRNYIGSPNDSNLMFDKSLEIQEIFAHLGIERSSILLENLGEFNVSENGQNFGLFINMCGWLRHPFLLTFA
ncbi:MULTISPECIES: hypothetical protein [unclassified Fibrobacter]|uniref:hypothetical protein n=1 Tax=unclassified Fibrobacter TaxID=2634177 RepID=UPI000D6BCA77|nr:MULTISPECIES: hypothetical protein [unclassified Fibrobacter]PWJ54796.1 hypothetical protein BGX12_1715 [Fibrobacter sp. UWR4]PZW61593.1 hypothetical protein C8E88_10742 [Fibrobacter sp. UWR1]